MKVVHQLYRLVRATASSARLATHVMDLQGSCAQPVDTPGLDRLSVQYVETGTGAIMPVRPAISVLLGTCAKMGRYKSARPEPRRGLDLRRAQNANLDPTAMLARNVAKVVVRVLTAR